jgi:hypothetical protein
MKTVIDIRDDLWERAKILAAKDRTDLKTVVNQALEIYLKERSRGKREDDKK